MGLTVLGSLQILSVVAIILIVGIHLGGVLYRVSVGQRSWLETVYTPVERLLYRLVGVNPTVEMDWKAYLKALLLVNLVMMLFVYLLFRVMGHLPLNPDHISSMPWALAFNTAVSFITNTNWQNYAGESSMT